MKKSRVILCILMALLLMCSCGGPMESPESGGEDTGDVELVLWAFPVGSWSNPTTVSSLLSGFHKSNPGINVTVEFLDYDSGDDKVAKAAGEGTLPDLVLEGPERLVANWGEKGWMADLSELWEADSAGGIYENVRTACFHSDGKSYVFPICMSAHCMAINYDMFEAAGALQYIDEEAHTWTTEGFINAVNALTSHGYENAGVLYCANQSGDQGTRALVTNLYSGAFTDKGHTSYTVNSPENRRALQLLSDTEGLSFEPEITSAEAIASFCRGESAMCFCWNGSLAVQQTVNNPDFNFKVFPMAFPSDDGVPELQGGIWGFGVFDSGNESRVEAAKTFIRYMTGDGAYTRSVLASSYWPVRDIGNLYENDALMTEYSIFMPYMGDYYQITPGWSEVRTTWCQLLKDIGNGTPVDEAVERHFG